MKQKYIFANEYIRPYQFLYGDLIGRAAKLRRTRYAKNIIWILTLSFFTTKCYNIGKILFRFLC